MKIGILVTNIGNFGAKGLYNSQEIGMAKALNNEGHQVEIYKYISNKINNHVQTDFITDGINIRYIPVKSIGTHGIDNLDEISTDINYLIYFSDIQLMLSKVYKWCKRNSVNIIPYVGVIQSNSFDIKTKLLTNLIAYRNISLYKKCNKVITKTPHVKELLENRGVKNIEVMPVGLDIELLKRNYFSYDIDELKEKYNILNNEKIILFIGRLEDEKNPLAAIDILNILKKRDSNYKLLMIGKGILKDKVLNYVNELQLEENFIYYESIPNKNIWEVYRISECFINLNRNEIFGMAILEAMFYECKVVAWEAPGPNFIIENGKTGYVINSIEEIIDKIIDTRDVEKKANERIVNNFMWKNVGEILLK